MSGVGEASLVLGLVSSTIAIFEAAHGIYEAASDASRLPKKIRFVGDQIPLVQNALGLARKNIDAKNVTREALESVKPVLEQCQKNATDIKEIFEKTIPAKDASRKSSKVKQYMEEIFKSLQLLARNQVFQDTETLEEINGAIEHLKNISDGEEDPQFVHSGTGPLNTNTGGTQQNYTSSGSGTQYNAQNQYFGQDQVKGSK